RYEIPFCVANRSSEKLDFFKSYAETKNFTEIVYEVTHAKHDILEYDIIVNATSAGLSKNLPLPKEILQSLFTRSNLAFDLMYQQGELTTFCKLASQCNIPFLDGKNMLVYQAAISFLYFHCNENLEHEARNLILQDIITLMNSALGIQ
ncbi:hypothetical protein CQA66_05475, partial [Helicobacter aurati]